MEVISRCYTKIVSGAALKLTGKELEEAKALRGEEVKNEKEIQEKFELEILTTLRYKLCLNRRDIKKLKILRKRKK